MHPRADGHARGDQLHGHHGRGLICLALPATRIDALGLPLMSPKNSSRHETAFTMSIEAREGAPPAFRPPMTAPIPSWWPSTRPRVADIATPGHVFPLRARRRRAGAPAIPRRWSTSRLAGMNPSGVICEIMNEDGTMAARSGGLCPAARAKIGNDQRPDFHRRRHDNLIAERAQRPVHPSMAATG